MRYAWTMKLREGAVDAYRQRHAEIWPDMLAALDEAGMRDYAIFVHGDRLFGTFAVDDIEASLAALRTNDVTARWRASMAHLVENDPDPKTGYLPFLECLFHKR